MKTRIIKTVVPLIVIMFIFSAAPAYGEHGHKGKRMENFIEKLGLTVEQQELLRQEREAHKGVAKQVHEALKNEREALRKELEKPVSNQAQIDRLTSSIKVLQSQIVDLRVEKILSMKEILTPEQFKKFSEMTEKHREKRKQKKQGKFKKHQGVECAE